MYIPLPFPECSTCHCNNNNSYHKDCSGLLEIDPYSEIVHCTSCDEKWNVWDSTYHCTCGHVFEAHEIKGAVDDILEMCKLCAEELDLMQTAYWKRQQLTTESKRTFIEIFFRGLGYVAGVLFQKLVDIALKLFIKV